MGKIYITSDLHFCHDREFIYASRGFNSIEEHDESIVSIWNEIITDEDEVYLLGDLILMDTDRGMGYVKQLKGKIHVIIGNHDSQDKIDRYLQLDNIVEVVAAAYLSVGKVRFYLSHYPTLLVQDKFESFKPPIINLFGHTHQNENTFIYEGKVNPFMYHVGMDSHNCMPILIEDIIEDIYEINPFIRPSSRKKS